MNEFGIKRQRAIELVQQVAQTVDRWQANFAQLGVCASGMDLLQASIDRQALKQQRKAYC